MPIEDTSYDEGDDQGYCAEAGLQLTLAIPPELPEETRVFVHDLLEFLKEELHKIYDRKVGQPWYARGHENGAGEQPQSAGTQSFDEDDTIDGNPF